MGISFTWSLSALLWQSSGRSFPSFLYTSTVCQFMWQLDLQGVVRFITGWLVYFFCSFLLHIQNNTNIPLPSPRHCCNSCSVTAIIRTLSCMSYLHTHISTTLLCLLPVSGLQPLRYHSHTRHRKYQAFIQQRKSI